MIYTIVLVGNDFKKLPKLFKLIVNSNYTYALFLINVLLMYYIYYALLVQYTTTLWE